MADNVFSGLGIGTTPAAFVAHGIDTTVVEIDPVVHEFASKYFQLPDNHTAVIDDAVSYTASLVNDTEARFDYIVHDVFTGGAEPISLFTLEFLQGLNALLKPEGTIAIVCLPLFPYLARSTDGRRTTPATSRTRHPKSSSTQSKRFSRAVGYSARRPLRMLKSSSWREMTSPTWSYSARRPAAT